MSSSIPLYIYFKTEPLGVATVLHVMRYYVTRTCIVIIQKWPTANVLCMRYCC